MKYLLDTNACIEYLRKPQSQVRSRLERLRAGDVCLCSPVLGELYYGAFHSQNSVRNLQLIEEFHSTLTSLPFDDLAAVAFGNIRSDLASLGMLIGPYDLQIAAIAIANDLTLVTHNTSEFARVSNLRLEDWQIWSI